MLQPNRVRLCKENEHLSVANALTLGFPVEISANGRFWAIQPNQEQTLRCGFLTNDEEELGLTMRDTVIWRPTEPKALAPVPQTTTPRANNDTMTSTTDRGEKVLTQAAAAKPPTVGTAQGPHTLKQTMAVIRPLAESFVAAVQAVSPVPDEAELELGLSLSAEGDFYVVKGEAQASHKVKLTWRNINQPNPKKASL